MLSLSYYSIHKETWFGLIRSTLLSTIFVYRLVLRDLTTSVGCFFEGGQNNMLCPFHTFTGMNMQSGRVCKMLGGVHANMFIYHTIGIYKTLNYNCGDCFVSSLSMSERQELIGTFPWCRFWRCYNESL